MGFKEYWGGQFGKPTGFSGKIVTFLMNTMNKTMYKTVLREVGQNSCVLDIGFGNGYMLKKLLRKNNSKFFGIDISADMVNIATRKNKKATRQGKLKLAKASIESIPFENNFDQIYTINTVYFWQDLSKGLTSIYNKLDKGGVFFNVCYTKQWLDKLGYTKNYKKYTEDELLQATKSVGFNAEIVVIKPGKSFYIKAVK